MCIAGEFMSLLNLGLKLLLYIYCVDCCVV